MPLYEYRCSQCGEEFEKMVRFSEADQEQVCPKCRSTDTKKKLSVVAATGAAQAAHAGAEASTCRTRRGFS